MLHLIKNAVQFKKLQADLKRCVKNDPHFEDPDSQMAHDEMELFKTHRILEEAARYNVPVSYHYENEKERYWQECVVGNSWYLTREGYHKIINDVRAEKKERREDAILWWIPIIGAVTGLVGTIVSLVAILKA